MGQLVFQANAGGQTALVGPNPSTSISINIPATNGNMVTTGDTGTVTSTMLATSVYTAPGTIGSGTPNSGAFTSLSSTSGTLNGSIGATTANTGAFTTLSASSTVSGTGFTNYLASPPAIGGTAPNAVSATTLTLGGTQNQQLGQGNASIMKNRIINGAMVIDQRNAGASVTITSGGTFTLDRWKSEVSQASKFSVQQNASSVTPPVGFTNYLGITSLSAYSVGASEQFLQRYNIEGFNTADLDWGTANAKTVTLSCWVRSSLTGAFGGSFQNSATDRNYPFSYTISSANTWELKSITVAGDTTGTWLTTNGVGIRVNFSVGSGSTYSGTAGSWGSTYYVSATGATSVVGTNGATFYITGVQLEVGTQATSFEYRQYGTELALCQRYFEKSYNLNIAVGTASTAYSAWSSSGSAGGLTTAYLDGNIQFKVPKRDTPSMAAWDEANNSGKCTRISPGILATSNQDLGFAQTAFNSVNVSSTSGASAGRFTFNWTSNAEL